MGGLYLREDYRFNTQPPEGGCIIGFNLFPYLLQFQHTAARRRLLPKIDTLKADIAVSTHSRPKAAAIGRQPTSACNCRFQHTAARRRLRRVSMLKTVALPFQHTAARRRLHAAQEYYQQLIKVSTHSRPKAAAHRKALKIYQT